MIDDADRTRKAGAVDLRDLAEWTGGQLLFSGTLADTAAVTSSLIAELRQQYVLAIEAASAKTLITTGYTKVASSVGPDRRKVSGPMGALSIGNAASTRSTPAGSAKR